MLYALTDNRPFTVDGGRSIILENTRSFALGAASSVSLTEDCLTRIYDPAGEGKRTFIKVWADDAPSRSAQDVFQLLPDDLLGRQAEPLRIQSVAGAIASVDADV